MGEGLSLRSQAAYDALVGGIYDAALDAERWGDTLETFARFMGAGSGMLRLIDRRGPRVLENHHAGFDPVFQSRYEKYFVQIDPFFRVMPQLGPPGTIHASAAMVPTRVLRKTEFYCDFMQPQAIANCIGGLLCGDNGQVVYYGLQRSGSSRAFDNDDLKRMKPIVDHLRRAYRTGRRIRSLEARCGAREAALDRFGIGVVLIDKGMRALYANGTAEEQFACEGAALSLRSGRLAARDEACNRKLQKLLWAAAGAEHRVHGAIGLGGNDGATFSLIAAPLSGPEHTIAVEHSGAAAVVFIDSDCHRSATDFQVVAALYGMTAAESKVAIDLASGYRVADIAERHGTRENTVRSQLKSAMHKTGTKRQAELVRLLSGVLKLKLDY